jgi:Flp pilus assembly protein TadD
MLQEESSTGRPPRQLAARWVLPLAMALLALSGCEPFPLHLDPLSVNGRDGGGAPPSYDSLMRIGAAARSGGDYANAVGVFRRAAEIAPTQPAPFVELGNTLLQTGGVDEAIVAYNSALARDSSNPAALLGLAKAYLRTARPELALEPLSKAIAEHPDDPKVLLVMGVADDQTGRHRQAQDYYRHGLDLDPGNPALTTNLALSLALSGDYVSAVAVLQPIAMGPKASARERQSLALIYGLKGNAAEAARLGRIDLDEPAVSHNLAYYETLRTLSPEARNRAILSAGAARAS